MWVRIRGNGPDLITKLKNVPGAFGDLPTRFFNGDSVHLVHQVHFQVQALS